MANREILSGRRSVADVSVNTSTEDLTQALSGIGQKIIAQNQEARINEQFSKAQLEVQKLDNQYQLDYEHDPLNKDGLAKYKADRTAVFDGLGKDISPFFKKPWQDSTRELGTKSDGALELWGFSQTRKNTVRSINTSIKNNLMQAGIDGQNWGKSDQTDVGALLNYSQSAGKLAGYADKNLGKGSSKDLMEGYSDNYLKSVLSGVSETNPLKALRLMDNDQIIKGFKDPEQYGKMKDAIEARALKVQDINGQQEVLSTLKQENNVLTQSLAKPLPYAQLQQAMDQANMSPEARSFFMKANGYTKADGSAKLSDADKLSGKAEIYEGLTQLISNPNTSTDDIKNYQGQIYKAMNQDVLTPTEGLDFINQLVNPFVGKKEESFKNYSTNTGWFGLGQDIGFKGVQEMFDNDFAIKPAEGDDDKAGPLTESINNGNKVLLYDLYMNSLKANASSYTDAAHPQGLAVGDIPNLNSAQQRKLYGQAQSDARKLYLQQKNPALASMPDVPNQVLSGGTLTQGMVGPRNVPVDKTAKQSFKVQIGSDGNLYRLYPDGKREKTGPAPEGLRY